MEKVSAKLRRIPWWKWGWAAWLLAVLAFIILMLCGNENWFEGGGGTSWIIAGSVLASFAVQSLRFSILPWLYGFARKKAGRRIALSTLAGAVLFTYFLLGLLNAVKRYSVFGSPFASKEASGIIYGQIMLPNGYEFGLPDIAIAICLAVIVDFIIFIPMIRGRFRTIALPVIALLFSLLLYAVTLGFSLLIRNSIAIFL